MHGQPHIRFKGKLLLLKEFSPYEATSATTEAEMLMLIRKTLKNGVILRIRYVSETEQVPEATSGWREK